MIKVLQLLKQDRDFRLAQNARAWKSDDDLFSLDQLTFGQEWDNSLPTLVPEVTYSKARKQTTNNSAFCDLFFGAHPEFKSVDMSNILVAGGCIGGIINNVFAKDIDLFVYGLSEDEANEKVLTLTTQLIEARKQLKKDEIAASKAKKSYYGSHNVEVKLIRNANGLSIFIDQRIYQIIFRLYTSKSEILHGFDVGSSAVGFDGQNVFFTSLSKFSYEFMCNIVDTSRRSTTYEKRLKKYFSRGFKIIVPYMNVSLLRKEYFRFNACEYAVMPCWSIAYNHVVGNQIAVKEFHCEPSVSVEPAFNVEDCENYTSSMKTDYELDDLDEYNILFINITHILNDPSKMYHFALFEIQGTDGSETSEQATEQDEEESDEETIGMSEEEAESSPKKKTKTTPSNEMEKVVAFFNTPPFLSKTSAAYFYDDLRRKVFSRRNLHVGLLEKYITVASVKDITARMYGGIEKPSEVLNQVVEKQKAHVMTLLDQVAANSRNIKWITDNPGTQLTSSFNPIMEDAEKWYGQYYNTDVNKI